ncbi:MAG: citrate (Si)-synthase [Candidatus Eisenbacteria bacterium]|nr:citrate (Si)-synthase [Candidatus Eisenbacteria bacterium]
MSALKKKLKNKIDEYRPRTTRLLKEYGEKVIDQVTISQVIGGMRGIKCLTTDISFVDPEEGIRFRGHDIPDTLKNLPKPPGRESPYVEGHVYLLLTGDFPTDAEAKELVEEFKERRKVPKYVWDVLQAMSKDAHPMTMFSNAILSMQQESHFVREYNKGIHKNDMWDPTYEDAMDIIARVPVIAAYIYRLKYKGNKQIEANPQLDLGDNFAHMMGISSPYDDLSKLYFILHSDHESGNVSAHTTHLVASALSDGYYSLSAGLNGLAGPLHGLASQEVLRWVQDLISHLGGKVPDKERLTKHVWDTLNSGQVVPGYGHAVLRKTDPRYVALRDFCLKHLPDDDIFKMTSLLYEVVPKVLVEHGKAKDPWPNVDAQSGVPQWHYGVKEYDFYTVLFGVGRAIGVMANIVWDRALAYPIERPKSVTTSMLEKMAGI